TSSPGTHTHTLTHHTYSHTHTHTHTLQHTLPDDQQPYDTLFCLIIDRYHTHTHTLTHHTHTHSHTHTHTHTLSLTRVCVSGAVMFSAATIISRSEERRR